MFLVDCFCDMLENVNGIKRKGEIWKICYIGSYWVVVGNRVEYLISYWYCVDSLWFWGIGDDFVSKLGLV